MRVNHRPCVAIDFDSSRFENDPTEFPAFVVTTSQPPRNASRIVLVDGVEWKVFEHERIDRKLERSLVFSTQDIVRRVRNYPANWRSLDDAALFALSRKG
jgi:hypothetical protein